MNDDGAHAYIYVTTVVRKILLDIYIIVQNH